MPKPKGKQRAADRLAAMPSKNWFANLTKEDREEVLEIRRRFQGGDYADKSRQQVYDFIVDTFKLSVSMDSVRRWLDRQDS